MVDFDRRCAAIKALDSLVQWRYEYRVVPDGTPKGRLDRIAHPPLIGLAKGGGQNLRCYIFARRLLASIGLR